ncbi:MAG: alpha/beta hydrolase [Ktedonobacterales bacterium]
MADQAGQAHQAHQAHQSLAFHGKLEAGSTAPAFPPGSRYPLLPGVRSRLVQTSRLTQHVYVSGPANGEPLVLIHGNASSARFFEELMAALPDYAIYAPDLRGYGASEAKVLDATRGLRDFSDDIAALVSALGLARFHLLGWSLGGNIAMQYTLDHPQQVRSLTLHATGSPYGYGCTHGPDGVLTCDDFAGSGGGLISPQVRACYEAKDSGADSPFSPRNGLRQVIVKPTFQFAPEREDALVEQMLMMRIGDDFYPGYSVPSPNWPFSAPGVAGANNALSPKYPNQSALAELRNGPPILWVHGTDDALVSDMAMGDPGALGKLGYIPGWPGEDAYPPQPMVTQIRSVLDRYAANGGAYHEEVFADCGHAPLLEHPERFRALFTTFLRQHHA